MSGARRSPHARLLRARHRCRPPDIRTHPSSGRDAREEGPIIDTRSSPARSAAQRTHELIRSATRWRSTLRLAHRVRKRARTWHHPLHRRHRCTRPAWRWRRLTGASVAALTVYDMCTGAVARDRHCSTCACSRNPAAAVQCAQEGSGCAMRYRISTSPRCVTPAGAGSGQRIALGAGQTLARCSGAICAFKLRLQACLLSVCAGDQWGILPLGSRPGRW